MLPGVSSLMKRLLTLTVAALAVASVSTSAFAGSCGGCASGDKSKDKTEEGAQS